MSFELVEGSRPEPPVRSQPVVDLGQRLETQPVEAPLGVGPDVDEAGLAQHSQVLGHRRLTHVKPVDELADGTLAVAQKVEDLPAAGLGEDGEAHRPSMPPWLYECQGMKGFALYVCANYNARVTATSNARVSHRGQTSLPAELRRRWGIDQGGVVGFIDLGDAALVVPGGVVVARQELRRVLETRYEAGLASLGDPDLADQQP